MVSRVAGRRGNAQPLCDPENAPGDDGQMKARDHKHVKRAGALKPRSQRMREISAIAGHHCGQHDGVVLAEAKRARQLSHRGGQCQQACSDGVLRIAPCGRRTVAGRREWLPIALLLASNRGRRRNALVEQIVLAAPCAWIVIALGWQQADDGSHAIAAMEAADAGTDGPANGQTNCAADRHLRVFCIRDFFKLETRRSIRCAGLEADRRWLVHVLLRSRCAPDQYRLRFLPLCAADRRRTQPAPAPVQVAAPSPHTRLPAAATAAPAAATTTRCAPDRGHAAQNGNEARARSSKLGRSQTISRDDDS